MSLAQEIADLRAAVVHLLHHGLPKSETDANAMVDQIHANVGSDDTSKSSSSGSGSSSKDKSS